MSKESSTLPPRRSTNSLVRAIAGMKIGREWRIARDRLISWVATGSQADQLAAIFKKVWPKRS